MSCVTKECTLDAITTDEIEDETANCVKFDDKCVTCDTVSAYLKGKDHYEFFRDPVYKLFGDKDAAAWIKATSLRKHRKLQPKIKLMLQRHLLHYYVPVLPFF